MTGSRHKGLAEYALDQTATIGAWACRDQHPLLAGRVTPSRVRAKATSNFGPFSLAVRSPFYSFQPRARVQSDEVRVASVSPMGDIRLRHLSLRTTGLTCSRATMETTRFDASELLDTPARRAAYLSAAFETGDPKEIRDALGIVARARGLADVAREAKLSRTSLYKTLGGKGNPEFGTVVRVLASLGIRLTATPAVQPRKSARRPYATKRTAAGTSQTRKKRTATKGGRARS